MPVINVSSIIVGQSEDPGGGASVVSKFASQFLYFSLLHRVLMVSQAYDECTRSFISTRSSDWTRVGRVTLVTSLIQKSLIRDSPVNILINAFVIDDEVCLDVIFDTNSTASAHLIHFIKVPVKLKVTILIFPVKIWKSIHSEKCTITPLIFSFAIPFHSEVCLNTEVMNERYFRFTWTLNIVCFIVPDPHQQAGVNQAVLRVSKIHMRYQMIWSTAAV